MTKLPAQDWLSRPATQKVMAALEAARPDGARFVGGCVRNALMGVPVSDIDIATQLPPDDVVAAMKREGIAVHPAGLQHGTVTAVADGDPFEITTLRRDVATDGRHAEVAFTNDWVEDAHRRDFRMNALYASADGEVHDPTGAGLEDVEARRVVFIGEAEARIREDYLRILRFFRFNAWYGRKALNAEGLSACAALKSGLAQISVERIWAELKKTLGARDPRRALKAMAQSGVLSEIAPEAHGLDLLDRVVALDEAQPLAPDAMVRFMALFSKDSSLMRRIAARLKLSNAERTRLILAASDETELAGVRSEHDMRRALYAVGAQTFQDRVRLAWADRPDARDDADWRALLNAADGWDRPELPLSGEDVLEAGVAPGPDIGDVIRAVEDWWVDADFTDDRAAVLEQLKTVVQAR